MNNVFTDKDLRLDYKKYTTPPTTFITNLDYAKKCKFCDWLIKIKDVINADSKGYMIHGDCYAFC